MRITLKENKMDNLDEFLRIFTDHADDGFLDCNDDDLSDILMDILEEK